MADGRSKSVIPPPNRLRLAGRIAHSFIDSKLTPLVIVAALLAWRLQHSQDPTRRRAADRRADAGRFRSDARRLV